MDITEVGADTSFGLDYYRVWAQAQDTLSIRTHTPSIGPGGFENHADPVIELYAPDGRLLAVADNNAGDGRNAALTFDADEAGD